MTILKATKCNLESHPRTLKYWHFGVALDTRCRPNLSVFDDQGMRLNNQIIFLNKLKFCWYKNIRNVSTGFPRVPSCSKAKTNGNQSNSYQPWTTEPHFCVWPGSCTGQARSRFTSCLLPCLCKSSYAVHKSVLSISSLLKFCFTEQKLISWIMRTYHHFVGEQVWVTWTD